MLGVPLLAQHLGGSSRRLIRRCPGSEGTAPVPKLPRARRSGEWSEDYSPICSDGNTPTSRDRRDHGAGSETWRCSARGRKRPPSISSLPPPRPEPCPNRRRVKTTTGSGRRQRRGRRGGWPRQGGPWLGVVSTETVMRERRVLSQRRIHPSGAALAIGACRRKPRSAASFTASSSASTTMSAQPTI